MKQTLGLLCIGAILSPLFASDPVTRQTLTVSAKLPRNVLSNEGIVLLSEAGYDEDFLADIIAYKQTSFDLSVEGLAYLATHGISERVVRFMIASEHKSVAPVERAEPVIVRARVVRQKVLVPDVRAKRGPLIPPSVNAAAAPYAMVESHLFRNRWYIVSPSNTSADPIQPNVRRASYFPTR